MDACQMEGAKIIEVTCKPSIKREEKANLIRFNCSLILVT